MTELDRHVPALVKQLLRRAWTAAQRALAAAQELEYRPTAKALYEKYELIAEQHAVAAWHTLNGLPLFAQVAHIMVPTVEHWAEKYNQAVTDTAERGYTASHYFMIVPVKRIAKIFGADDNEPAVSNNAGYVVVS